MATNEQENDTVTWQNKQLSYIGQNVERIPYILGNLYGKQAKRVDLSYNSIKSLDGLENFRLLEELILDNNRIDDIAEFPYNPYLRLLSLNKNKLKNIDRLLVKLSKSFPNLRFLSLLGNPACPDQLSSSENDEDDYRRYRYYVLYNLPRLNFLDSTMVSNVERFEAARVGSYMRTVRPPDEVLIRNQMPANEDFPFTPLQNEDDSNETQHRGAYGRLRYKYTGKNSEGNRFIQNNQL